MINAYANNRNNEKIFVKTQGKNVFDKNGLDIDSNLEIIFNELSKRDIKRTYFDLKEFELNDNYTTYDIVNAMADYSIAILSFENDSHIIEEIGSRAGGVMVLYKTSSVYFSSGFFFTYRYGEVFHCVSGLGGNSVVWYGDQRTIHSLHNGAQTKLTKVDMYEKITGWGGNANNPRLIINSDGGITIPKGVNNIIISATVVIESVEPGIKFMAPHLNNTPMANLFVKQNVVNTKDALTLTITNTILPVSEGDVIDLRIQSNSLDTLRMKHFTIEVLN